MIPMKHFTRYLAQFCFFQKKTENVYQIFRFFLKHHISKLYDFNPKSKDNLISKLKTLKLGLGMIFERMFLRYMNQLYLHLRTINIFPLDIAFGWMTSMFFNCLKVSDSFSLVDRMIGYGDNMILAILSLAIFKYYEKGLLEAEDREDVDTLFVNISEMNMLEVLNYFLFYSN